MIVSTLYQYSMNLITPQFKLNQLTMTFIPDVNIGRTKQILTTPFIFAR